MNEMVHKRGLLRWSLSLIRCSVQLHYGTVSEVPHGPICLDITDLVRANSFIEGEIEFQILTPILVKESTIFSVLENLT